MAHPYNRNGRTNVREWPCKGNEWTIKQWNRNCHTSGWMTVHRKKIDNEAVKQQLFQQGKRVAVHREQMDKEILYKQ